MKDSEIRDILRRGAGQTNGLKPAGEFWADFRRQALLVEQEAPAAEHTPRRWTSMMHYRYPILAAAAASIAACAVLVLALYGSGGSDQGPAFSDIKFGNDFRNNGAIVITDGPTDANILWVLAGEGA